MTSRLPHLYQHFGEKLKHSYFDNLTRTLFCDCLCHLLQCTLQFFYLGHYNYTIINTTRPVQQPLFQDNLGKPVPEK